MKTLMPVHHKERALTRWHPNCRQNYEQIYVHWSRRNSAPATPNLQACSAFKFKHSDINCSPQNFAPHPPASPPPATNRPCILSSRRVATSSHYFFAVIQLIDLFELAPRLGGSTKIGPIQINRWKRGPGKINRGLSRNFLLRSTVADLGRFIHSTSSALPTRALFAEVPRLHYYGTAINLSHPILIGRK